MRYFNSIMLICILHLLIGQNGFCQTSQIEITSSEVTVNLDLPDSQLLVRDGLTLHRAGTVNTIDLILSSDAKIKSVKTKIKGGVIDLSYKFTGKDTLSLTIPPTLKLSRDLKIDFEYAFPSGGLKDSLMIFDRGYRWYPLILEDIFKFKLKVEVPPGYIVFSAGDLIEKKTSPEHSQFTYESKIPVFKLPLVIAKTGVYNETFRKCSGKEIYFYSTSVDKEVKEKIISEACATLKFYNDYIGEYPHNRLTLVEIPEMEGTNIATGLLMIGSTFIKAFKQGYYDNLHLSIAAQWTAAGVFFKLFGKGFWFFQLSLPHYLRLIYLERTKGEDAFITGLNQGLDTYKEFAGTDKDMPIIEIDFLNTKEKGAVIYGKGPYVLDKVRREIGDENWNKLVRDVYKDFKGKILYYGDFIKYLSKYDRERKCVLKFEKMLSETGLNGD
ncbi:MAG: hypothetical protein MUO78_06385 [candidate division Zixibacteria bacterium]|nr:hypothetical protein [candidate division Zixibacteria bacterium]